ncbi:uncharacterized protein Tco025E_08511 [Trypanosoma conorhini]|uniref:Uncharacterized protein n=1 Tax=Trypanosoma conorhini TaxID=83891 RepID=A0A3R7NF53_9TRYP|nr:uncharacterized protein Tco025E_08511 [Trypanosoma conorhini]RNF01784.1 hypothetical protein Tco025E_08511 [Trypanosoma conorhini]
MYGVGAGGRAEPGRGQRHSEERDPEPPFCFSIKFDADPAEVGDSVFRGAQAFRSPTEIAVPLQMPLKGAAVSDLLSSFMLRTFRRFPHLSTRTVEAFFIDADGNCLAPRVGLGHPHLLRLDACVNRDDTLDNFFTPVNKHGRNVYDVIAHWTSPNLAGTAANNAPPAKVKTAEDGEEAPSDTAAATNTLPAPVIYPFTHRCTYARLLPRESSSQLNAVPPNDEAEAPLPAVFVSIERRELARKVRRALEGKERVARDAIIGDERSYRAVIAEVEDEEREQTVALLRLMDVDVPECGVKATSAPRQRTFRDTEPLASLPSAPYMTELTQRAEETAWLSRVFAKTSISGPALAAAKEKNNLGAFRQADTAYSAGLDGEMQMTIEASKARQDLIQHYADVRCDLLLWERQSFRSLTMEMRNILAKQKQLDEEIVRRAFSEEIEKASVLEFGGYVHHYNHKHLRGELTETSDTEVNCISDAPKDSNGVIPFVVPRPVSPPQAPVFQEGAAMGAKDAGSRTISVPGANYPHSVSAEDAYLREALERSKARAKAALDTIARIDMRYYEPVAFKLAKHRLSFDEKGVRNVLLAEEEEAWRKVSESYKEDEAELAANAYLALQRVFEPVVKAEEKARAALVEQQERHLALLLSLYHHGMERLEMSRRHPLAADV